MNSRPYSLYVHVPYCAKKCPYCDFNTHVEQLIPEERYVDNLIAELDLQLQTDKWRGRQVRSIYFGGGTPSLFEASSFQDFISYTSRNLGFDDQIEITLEANPGTVSREKLAELREAGINRLSFGFQSFSDKTLKLLGRDHNVQDIFSAFSNAKQVGFRNISFDLMFGVPEQQMIDLDQDLSAALELSPQHISIYGLTIEKGTPFFQREAAGKLHLPNEDTCAAMLEKVRRTLKRGGYHHYEISNFAKVGFESRHNTAYWDGEDYLGLGAGAHSFCQELGSKGAFSLGRRWSNFAHPEKYMSSIENGKLPQAWQETLSVQDAIFEFFFLGLRKLQGLSLSSFETRFGFSHTEVYPALVEVLTAGGLLELDGDLIRLSEKGFMVADSVIGHFAELERVPRWLDASHRRNLEPQTSPSSLPVFSQ